MASEEIALVLSHCPETHLLFNPDSNLPFRNHHINHKTTRQLTTFIGHQNRHFHPYPGPEFPCGGPEWNVRNGRESSSPSRDGSDSNADDEDDDDDMNNGNVGFVNGSDNDVKIAQKNGLIRGMMKEGSVTFPGNDAGEHDRHGQLIQYQNAITVADPNGELYYSQLFNDQQGFKDMLVDNGCGFSGRNDGGSGESLRTILSDPLTGVLMDDAMILPCGHSFGSGGMQHVMRMKACYTCSHPVSESSIAPNLSLRAAIHAFRKEEELQTNRASKRRNKLDQDRSRYGGSAYVDQIRGRGVQFPFSVSERVIIKGNKRTPPRFVGHEAIVTTQCLNGWYVVKTLDNAESVKLQYRSLAKIQDSRPSTLASTKTATPNWL